MLLCTRTILAAVSIFLLKAAAVAEENTQQALADCAPLVQVFYDVRDGQHSDDAGVPEARPPEVRRYRIPPLEALAQMVPKHPLPFRVENDASAFQLGAIGRAVSNRSASASASGPHHDLIRAKRYQHGSRARRQKKKAQQEAQHKIRDLPDSHISCGLTVSVVAVFFTILLGLSTNLSSLKLGAWGHQDIAPEDVYKSTDVPMWQSDRGRACMTLLCFIGAVNVCTQMESLYSLFVQPVGDFLNEGAGATNLGFTCILVSEAILGPLMVTVSAYCGMRRMLQLAFVANVVAYSALTILPCVQTHTTAHLLGGFSVACVYSPACMAAMRLVPPHLGSAVIGALSASCMVVSCIISIIIRMLIQNFAIRAVYGMLGFVLVIAMGACCVFLPIEGDRLVLEAKGPAAAPAVEHSPETKPGAATGASESGGESIWTRRVALLYLVFFLDTIGFQFWEGSFQVIVDSTQPGSSICRSLGAPVLFMVCAGSRLVWGTLAVKRSATFLMACGSALFFVSVVLWALTVGSSYGTLAAIVLTAATMSSYSVLIPVVVVRSFSPKAATLLYSVLMTAQLGGLAIPLTTGMFHSLGWRLALILIAIVPLLSCLLKLFILKWDVPPPPMKDLAKATQ